MSRAHPRLPRRRPFQVLAAARGGDSPSLRAHSAILDGEICCLNPDGTSNFDDLGFRREWPFFPAFDLLAVDGEDMRALPLRTRKTALRRIMPRIESRLRYLDHIESRGVQMFRVACEHNLEEVVGEWANAVTCPTGARPPGRR